MKRSRVHLLGASGSGTTTLARALANHWRARMRKFPHGVFYRRDEGDILILRVLHSRRDVSAVG